MGIATNVLVGATGKVYGGVAGTALPGTASASLAAGFKDLGYVTEDGVSQSIGTDTTELKAWGGTTVRKMQTSHTLEYKFALMETNPDSLSAYYGSANFDDTNNVVRVVAGTGTRQEWIIDTVDGTNLIRVVIPDGEVTDRDDVIFKTDEAITYGVTITCYPDTTAQAVKAYEYLFVSAVS